MKKDNFLMCNDWGELFLNLPDEKAGQLIKAIYMVKENPDYQIDDPILSAVFQMIKKYINSNEEKYQEKCKKMAANGAKRFHSEEEESNSEQMLTNVNDSEQMLTNASNSLQIESDNDYDNDNDYDLKNKKNNPPLSPLGETEVDSLISEKGFSSNLAKYVKQWLAYKKEKHQGYKPQGLQSFLSIVKNHVDTYGDNAVIQVIVSSMAQNYQGVTWDKLHQLPKMRDKPVVVEEKPPDEEDEMTDEEWAALVDAAEW